MTPLAMALLPSLPRQLLSSDVVKALDARERERERKKKQEKKRRREKKTREKEREKERVSN